MHFDAFLCMFSIHFCFFSALHWSIQCIKRTWRLREVVRTNQRNPLVMMRVFQVDWRFAELINWWWQNISTADNLCVRQKKCGYPLTLPCRFLSNQHSVLVPNFASFLTIRMPTCNYSPATNCVYRGQIYLQATQNGWTDDFSLSLFDCNFNVAFDWDCDGYIMRF